MLLKVIVLKNFAIFTGKHLCKGHFFFTKECIVDNDHDPDVNFYHHVSMLDTQYLMPDKFKTNFKDFSKNSFSVLHLNIRSINKNFEAFTEFYSKLNYIFSVICFLKHGQVRKT